MRHVHARGNHHVYRAALVGAMLLGLASLLGGCDDITRISHIVVPPEVQVPQSKSEEAVEVHEVDVTILDGKLDADRYDIPAGADQLHITAQGGPYFVSVSTLAPDGVKVPAGGSSDLAFIANDAGDYTISVQSGQGGATEGSAILNVHQPGF